MPKWGDIRDVSAKSIRERGIGEITLISGGFPCQDLSVAGKQTGLKGERSGLWFEMLRVISELRPRWVLAENVRGAVNLALDTVKMGMETEGYKVWPFVIPASAFGAPHKRERLFVVGAREDVDNTASKRLLECERGIKTFQNSDRKKNGLSEQTSFKDGIMWPTPRGLYTGPDYARVNRPASGGDEIVTAVAKQTGSGQLNPDWVEILMGFPIGWTNLEVDEPEPWPGWPAPMGVKMWATPAAWDCQGASGGGMGRSLRTDIHNIKTGLTETCQFPYEPPRVGKGIKNRADRIKCLGNAVVPQQVYPILKAIAEIERCSKCSPMK